MDVNYSAKENAIRLAVRGWYDANPPIDLQAKVENNLRMNKADFLRRHKPVAMHGRAAPDTGPLIVAAPA